MEYIMTQDKKSGAHLVLIASILWSFAGICTKFIPWDPISIACIRGCLAAMVIGFFTKEWVFKINVPILLGAVGTVCTSILFLIANKITTASNAIVMQYTAPVFVVLFSIFFLKVRPSRIDLATIFITLGGISLFFIEHLESGAIWGDIIALLSGVTFSMVFFANRLPGADAMKASYLGCLLHIFLVPFLFFDKSLGNFNIKVFIIMLAMGIFQMGMAYVLFSKGIKSTEALSASIIAMIEPILNPIWVSLFIGENPGPLAVTGAVIVIITIVTYNIINARKVSRA